MAYNDFDDGELGIAPVAIATGLSFLTALGKKGSNARAAAVIPTVVNSANGGNLMAVAILDTRRSIGIAKERAVWANGFSQVHPDVLAAYDPLAARVKAMIPATAQATPEAAAQFAVSNPVSADQLSTPPASAAPNLLTAGLAPGMLGGASPLLLAGLGLGLVLVLRKRGGRRG